MKKAGKLAPPPAATDMNSVQARTEAVIKIEDLRGKRELVAPGMAIGNKGKSAGFYCQACDLTFKDSLSYLDHLNSANRKSPSLYFWVEADLGRLSKVGDFGEGGTGYV
jgi:hypothetical protein